MRNTKWIYKDNNTSVNSNINIDEEILTLLNNRGISKDEDINLFINTSTENIRNPLLLQDMEKAVDRIIKAKNENEEIWIYGDYDVDGITSTSLLYLTFEELGITPKYYIPLRDEGYGMNKEAISYIANEGGKLIISVDCGISSHQEIEHANSLGIDVIVTDHHEINNGIPNAFAVINPKREENLLPFKYLAGVGTAFMLVYALYTKLNCSQEVFKYLDIVAIGTVADIVPLVEENRIFTKVGMELLTHSRSLGLRMLIKKIFEDYNDRKFSTYDIGFIIAPIFNAAGRLEDAKKAVELFIQKDHVQCTNLIYSLLQNNSDRKAIQEDILQQATEIIEKKKLDNNYVIVVAKEDFHHGVIGIVASKILDRYYKPTIIMEIKKEEGIATASCRSIEGFNIIEALNSLSSLLIKYGGHAGAAGFSIKIENIDIFAEKINEYASEHMSDSNLIKPIKIDTTIPTYKISYDFLNKISCLEPFGFGNPAPMFALKNCEISNIRAIGQEKNHIMFNLKKDGVEIKNCVWFNSEDVFNEFISFTKADIAFKLKLETYKDRYQYKVFVEDIQLPSIDKENHLQKYINLYDTVFPLETVIYTRKAIDSKNVDLTFNHGEIDLTANRSYISTLDEQTTYILNHLKNMYNYDFTVSIKDIVLTDENYNVHIVIDKKYDFKSYSIKTGELFTQIKDFLIGSFNYNAFQKHVLATIFKEKKNCIGVYEKQRGVNTIIRTIGLFYKNMGKKVLCVTKYSLPKKTLSCVDISSQYEEGYDFYIFINPENIESYSTPTLILTDKVDNFPKDYKVIKDEFSIPKNIVITDIQNLMDKNIYFTKHLPTIKKEEIIQNLKNITTLYATCDILPYL